MTSERYCAVIGASGAIGSEFVRQYCKRGYTVHAFSRKSQEPSTKHVVHITMDMESDERIKQSLQAMDGIGYDCVIVATGVLHSEGMFPEKSMKALHVEQMARYFHVNTIIPSLIGKHFLPMLTKNRRAIFVALSARVGSISDNQLGGWYSYRSSKAALNMMLKTFAIEVGRYNKRAIVIGLHPGTVDSQLSQPFQQHVPEHQLFTPEFSVKNMCTVIDQCSVADSGGVFAWDGSGIDP